jgi:hypothetical protein
MRPHSSCPFYFSLLFHRLFCRLQPWQGLAPRRVVLVRGPPSCIADGGAAHVYTELQNEVWEFQGL